MEKHEHRDIPLDGVRGLAVLCVMIHHVMTSVGRAPDGHWEKIIYAVATEGWVGVDLFFVLSGFLITRILLNSKSDPHYFRNFYARRTLRIFPLYYAFIAALVIGLPLLGIADPKVLDVVKFQIWYWLYIPNFHLIKEGYWTNKLVEHTWSLGVEEQFYLVWPLVISFLSSRALIFASLFLGCSSLLLRIFMFQHGYPEVSTRVFTLSHLDGLMIGAIIASSAFAFPEVFKKYWRPAACAMLGLGFLVRITGSHFFHIPWVMAEQVNCISCWSLAFGGFILFAVYGQSQSRLRRILSTRLFVFFGTYSYCLYIVHLPIFTALNQLYTSSMTPPRAWLFIGACGIGSSIGISLLSFKFFETPFLKLKSKFSIAQKR